jgi:transketolase
VSGPAADHSGEASDSLTDFMRSLEPARLADGIRRAVIEQSRRANVGHIGSALSIADLIGALYAGPLATDAPDRDRFVLSKGHAALALYAALAATGRIPEAALDDYCGDGSHLGVHPERELAGVDFCSGSLGQGLSVAAGAALAARVQGSQRRAYVLLSDAELNEGSVWEAAMFAAHHKLDNLVALFDVNGQQALGYTKDVMDLGAVEDRFAVFGWDVQVVDGHDHELLAAALDTATERSGRPHVIMAQTTFGKGVSFMESRIEWHYLPLTEEQCGSALDELAAAAEEKVA